MVELATEDRQRLLRVLMKSPILSSYRGRLQTFQNAGLETLTPMIQLEGEPYVVLSEILTYLCKYGRISYEHEALGRFLNVVNSQLVGIEDQGVLEEILTQYELMVPTALSPEMRAWRGSVKVDNVLEKIIGENTLKPIAFLAKGLRAARSVAFINVGGKRAGTGFLISLDLLLTNHHVLPSVDELSSTIFRFNYQLDMDGRPEIPEDYQFLGGGIFYSSQQHDYSVVQLASKPGKRWAWLPLNRQSLEVGQRVNIIQHPAAQPKQISIQNNFVEYLDENLVQYVTSTLPGSSGSPVFNHRWDVVAMHHAGGMLVEPATQRHYFRNEGILISRILGDLPSHVRDLL